jgi:LuxR family maltose regulon positive regulatory protein
VDERAEHPLLLAKQVIPAPRSAAVVRPRLHDRLQASSATRLTVVVAPAGWGKTALLSQWARAQVNGRRVLWLSLDRADDEPTRFWRYVLTVLRDGAGPGCSGPGAAALAALSAPGLDPIDLALPTLLNELADTADHYVLVLDDYHVLTHPGIHESLEFLLAYLPSSLRVVLAGRSDPPLPLARMRARGELTEIRAADLRFTPDEARALVGAMGGSGSVGPALERLHQRTEGWAAGLQLAALAQRASGARGIPTVDEDRHVVEYLTAEVLDSLPAGHRDFLVRTSVLERLSAPLCDAVLDQPGSAAMLDLLDRSDLFVSRLDGQRAWYRCHRLFREVLRRELDATAPGEAARLLGRAADWLLAHDHVEFALHHHLAAGDANTAAAVLTDRMGWFVEHGLAASFLQIGERVSAELDPPDPRLHVMLVFAAGLCGRFDRVPTWLDAAEPLVTDDSPPLPGWSSLRAALLSRRATFGFPGTGSIEASVRDAARAVALEDDPTSQGFAVARGALGSMLMGAGRFAEAVDVLSEARRQPAWDRLTTVYRLQATSVLGLSLLFAGRIEAVHRVCRETRQAVADVEAEWGDAAAAAVTAAHLLEGRLALAEGRIEQARARLRRAAHLAAVWGQASFLVLALLSLADAELAAGDHDGARQAVDQAREAAAAGPVFPAVARELAAVVARVGRGARPTRERSPVVEQLTDRELAVLRALSGTATQREIGASLYLSINTVKGYTKALYRKLDVVTRQDAVNRGRELDLI